MVFQIKKVQEFNQNCSPTGTPTLGELPPLPPSLGAEGARVPLHTEFLPSLLSSEGAFSGIADSLVQENFSGCKPPDPQIPIELLGD